MNVFQATSLAIEHAGQQLLLHPQRVMYWPAQKTLLVADVHVGKEHVFARQGIGIPAGISESGLRSLFELATASCADRLIVLGDFMHAVPHSSERWLNVLTELMNQHSQLSVEIVAGNHDRQAGRSILDSRIIWHTAALIAGPWVLQHEPCKDDRGYVLCGHLHPVWRFGNARRGGVRAPVFWFREHWAVLPAFGEFTGGVVIEPDNKKDKLFITGPDCVISVPATHKLTRYKASTHHQQGVKP